MEREEKIIAYLLGELSLADKMEFEKSIVGDKALESELNAYAEAMNALDKTAAEKPSENLNTRFDSYLNLEIQKSKQESNSVIRFIPAAKWMGIAASILVAGFFLSQFPGNNVTSTNSDTINPEWMQTVSTGKTSQRIQAIHEVVQENTLDDNVLEAIESVVYNDPSANVQLAAVESLSSYVHQEEVKDLLINALQNIETPIVKIEIINILTQNKKVEAKETFEAMLNKSDLNKSVEQELHTNIRKLETII